MNVFQRATDLSAYLSKRKQSGVRSVGFVPTMGALHQGHISLINKALEEGSEVVVSIFVNPTQFNEAADLDNYPRPIENDLKLLIAAGVHTLFLPDADEIYGNNYRSEQIDLKGLDESLEGAHRPGHFQGVANVVRRLFDIVQPDLAYFGQKDYQQTLVIKRVVELYHPQVNIRVMPIIREENGLAMSSRNVRLQPEAREQAGKIYGILNQLKVDAGKMELEHALSLAEERVEKMEATRLDYLVVIDEASFEEAMSLQEERSYVALIALYYHGVRLIDNLYL